MGFLDEMIKQFEASGGVDQLLKENPQIMAAAKQFLGTDPGVGPSGGLHDILRQLESGGLGDIVSSWLGSGQNQSISGHQVKQAIDHGALSQFAERSGIDLGQAATVLAGLLPLLVDKASPQGSVPEGQGLDDLLGSLLQGLQKG